MKKALLLLLALLSMHGYSQRRMENLDRGLIASKVTDGVYVNWRITGQEWYDVGYNLYRDGVKIKENITGASNFIDPSGSLSSKYKVSAIVNGIEQSLSKEVAVLPNPYIELTLHPIPKINGVPDSYYDLYKINDIVTADLDGDGEYELIVKRVNEGYDSGKPYENQYYTLFDAYKLDGTFLWRIDVGPNVIHNVEINVLAYDLNGDGKAEVVLRMSEGSKVLDKNLNVIYEVGDEGNANGDPTPDGKTNYRNTFQFNSQWFDWEGPEYLALLNGETAQVYDRIDHIQRKQPGYNNGVYWGDSGQSSAQLAHRACKYHYGAPYLDGKNASLLVTRGIYGRIIMRTYDMVNNKLQERWEWKSETEPGYTAQGNHNYSIADVDGDGCDEIVYGSMTVDNTGVGLYTTRLGHGDAIHVGDFDPYRKGLEVFACLENSPYHGTTYRAAESGEILLQKISTGDEGRCMAANVTDKFKGAEMWPSATGSFSASEMKEIAFSGGSSNYRIFWDGDLLDELVDHNWNNSLGKGIGKIQKYNGSAWVNSLVTDGFYSCNHTKGTPCLQADLFGDWREEIIFRSADDTKIRIYFTTIPTEHRIYTLMHDMQYRQAVAWQMCGYNQPPHVSYFLGEAEGILLPPPPVMDNQRLIFQPTSSVWSVNSGNWKKDGVNTTYKDGEDVLFDLSGHTNGAITLSDNLSPRTLTINSLNDYLFDISGGKLTGSMKMIKQGRGTFKVNGNHDYSGVTEIWDGLMDIEGQLLNSSVWVNLHGELAAIGTLGKDVSLNYASIFYPGGKSKAGILNIGGSLELKEKSVLDFEISNTLASCDKIIVSGTLKLKEEGAIFRLNKGAETLNVGEYILIQTPILEGDLSKINVEGLGSQIGTLSYKNNNVILTIEDVRTANTITWMGTEQNNLWDVFGEKNFTLNSEATYFVSGDKVLFNDLSSFKTVNLSNEISSNEITIDANQDYLFQGTGKITGSTSLIKSGSGKLTLTGVHDYTGATIVNGGILAVESFPNLAVNGSLGSKSDNPDMFILNGGTLTSTNASGLKVSSKALTIGENGGTINTNTNFRWLAPIVGKTLTKTGTADLALYSDCSFEKLIIKGGSVTLGTASAWNKGTVVLESSSTFTSASGSGTVSTNFEVPTGSNSRIYLDGNTTYTGALTGDGTLAINQSYVRTNLNGNWSAFSGVLNVITNFVHSSWSAEMRISNGFGLANADVNISGKIYMHHLSNQGFALGSLAGTTDATLHLGSATWTIGNKNTNSTFNGLISGDNGKLTKVGTGALSLTNANTYTGVTTINGGRLLAMNTAGSATGTGAITVNDGGVFGGKGIVSGNVTVRANGGVEPGDDTSTSWMQKIATLTFDNNLTLNSGSFVKMSVRNMSNNPSDKIVVKGRFAILGKLIVEIVSGNETFAIGSKITLFDLSKATVSGEFTAENMTLPPVVAGGAWDTSKLLTEGTIEVVDAGSSISSSEVNILNVYPNPAEEFIVVELPTDEMVKINIYDLAGSIVLTKDILTKERIEVGALPQGIYFVKIETGGKSFMSKLIKK